MPTLTKTIAKPGKFYPTSPIGGRHKEPFEITPQRLTHWASQFKRMKEKGNVLPAPTITHKLSERPLSLAQLHERVKKGEYDKEAGWWSDIWLEEGSDGPELKAKLEVPDEASASSFKYVSPFIDPTWMDGTGEEFEDSIQHILLTNKPIAPDQGDFEPVEGEMSKGMAFFADDSGTDPTTATQAAQTAAAATGGQETSQVQTSKLTAAVKQLSEKFGVSEPEGITTADDLMAWILGVLSAGPNPRDTTPSPTTTPPEGAQTETPAPVAMSELIEKSPVVKALFAQAHRSQQQQYADRIGRMVSAGKITKQFAEERLLPQVNGYQFALTDAGEPERNQLDITLDVLEAAIPDNRALTGVFPYEQVQGAQFGFGPDGKLKIEEPPAEFNDGSMTPEETDEQVKEDAKLAGVEIN